MKPRYLRRSGRLELKAKHCIRAGQKDCSVPAADVIIVGGGVIGCSIAYYLTQAGARVTVFERGEIGGEASGAAAGMLAPLDDSLRQGPLDNLCLASLQLFRSLVDSLRDETGIDVEYVRSGVLRIAFTEEDATLLNNEWDRCRAYCSGSTRRPSALWSRALRQLAAVSTSPTYIM